MAKVGLIELLYQGNVPALIKRLKAGDDPNVSEGCESLLYCAVDKEQWTLVKLLLQCGASPNVPDSFAPLALAATKGQEEIVEALLQAGAVVDVRDEEGGTPLMDAAACGHAHIVSRLLEAGANAKAKDAQGRTAILYAAERKHQAVIELLLPRSRKTDQAMVKKLLSTARPQATDPEDAKRLLRAARTGATGYVKELLDEGVPVDVLSDEGSTPLMEAATSGRLKAVKLLVERGANVNCTNKYREGPLTYAAMAGYSTIYDYLLPLTSMKQLVKRAAKMREVMIEREQWKLPEEWELDD